MDTRWTAFGKVELGAPDQRGVAEDPQVAVAVLVENGGTVVIGGIYEQQSNDSVTKVPFLGDVPYLGNLFKTKTQDSQRTELLVFLTPKVVSGLEPAPLRLAPVPAPAG